jgi:hypothetical protein
MRAELLVEVSVAPLVEEVEVNVGQKREILGPVRLDVRADVTLVLPRLVGDR